MNVYSYFVFTVELLEIMMGTITKKNPLWSKKYEQRTISHNDDTTIHWITNLNNELSPIMTRLPFIGVTKS